MNSFEPLSRKQYFTVGVGLMVLKFLGEFSAHYVYTGEFLNPLIFLLPSLHVREIYPKSIVQPNIAYSKAYYVFLILWTLPFLWVGLNYSIRRARDAGMSPWFGMGFLIPLWNFVVMLVLSMKPTGEKEFAFDSEVEKEYAYTRVQAILLSGAATVLIFIPIATLSILVSPSYGALMFLVSPILISAIASYIWNRGEIQSKSSSISLCISTLFFLALVMTLFAVEGAMCLAMAFPFAIFGAFVGALIGRKIAAIRPKSEFRSDLLWITVPILFGGLGDAIRPETSERRVTSEVIVHAPIEKVWENVIAFPAIPQPTELLFTLGIAYPTHARIEGSGVGAVRYCSFSTGDFVEPITAWDPPRHLAFDVREQPLPMQESNPWGDIRPPHLYHSFRSSRGEFELIPQPDGSVLLRGNTYYRLVMGPTIYWALLSDEVVHTIHLRVLNHIRSLSESSSGKN